MTIVEFTNAHDTPFAVIVENIAMIQHGPDDNAILTTVNGDRIIVLETYEEAKRRISNKRSSNLG